ncbi:DHA2 family efflux MFS transporter permease subunit [Caulobacter sp. KR2-114]|uniref:DHA2 family efflux MFS transporter permease subunit n=1 Tax=Caulobacter sp. KR2-114 TaxID=3400912 RepID=UPI003C0F19FA
MASAQDIQNRIPITGAMILATLMNTLDSTIANVALPHIQGSVSAAQDQITWVLTSYIIATAIMTPLSGWLSQKFGRKRMFLLSIAGFTAASMLCGIATSLPEIVIFRLLQGIAGASMMPMSQNIMLDIFPMERLPQVMAIWSAAVILGPIVGPALGGWLTENYSWRWCFYINVPIGALAFAGLWIFMDHDDGGRQRKFDFLGFGALVLFVGAFQLMMDRGPSQDWFQSKEIWVEAAAGAAGLWVFVVQTATSDAPFFHRDLARDANFVGTTIFGFFVGALLFSITALLPSLMQNLLGYSVLESGLASMPRGLGSFCAFICVPFLLRRFGPRKVLVVGLLVSLVAISMMTQFDLSMTSQPIMVAGVIQGFGVGLLFSPLTSLAYVTLNPVHRTEGTIVSTMARSLGSSVGISMMQALLIRHGAVAHEALTRNIQPGDPVLAWSLPPFMNLNTASGLQILDGEISRQGSMISYDWVFGLIWIITLGLFPLLLILRPPSAPVVGPIEASE